MSAKFFKNSRYARKHLPKVFLSIQAVDKKLKPSYLWDAFAADVSEIQLYLEELCLLRLIDHKLDVLCIDNTVFVTLYDSLKQHLENFSITNIDLVDVSETVSIPSVLPMEVKVKILNPILKCFQEILAQLNCQDGKCMKSIDYNVCNPSTLFGILLGYPVLYWFSHQSPHSEFACLSMLPLKVHRVVTRISLPGDYSKVYFNSKNMPVHHELFTFSIPENLYKETEYVVKSWFHMLSCKGRSNTMFSDFKIQTNVISLPSVSM